MTHLLKTSAFSHFLTRIINDYEPYLDFQFAMVKSYCTSDWSNVFLVNQNNKGIIVCTTLIWQFLKHFNFSKAYLLFICLAPIIWFEVLTQACWSWFSSDILLSVLVLFALLWLTAQRWNSPVSCAVGSIYSKPTGRKTGKFLLCAPLSTFDAAHFTLWSLSVEELKEEPILPGFLLTPKVCNK